MVPSRKPLKIGFIGGAIDSAIGYTHYIASKMDNYFILSAGCFSRREDVNKETALNWGVKSEHLYSDWKKMLIEEKGSIDAVVILAPTPNHHEMVMTALSLDYAIICEKPLASSHAEALEIAQKVEEKNAFLAVTHNYTAYPMLRELQIMIQQGKLGDITHINIEMPQEGFARFSSEGEKPSPQSWRLAKSNISGVSLDLGTHLQHMIYFLTEENPVELVADKSSFGWFDEVTDNIYCIFRYASGMKVSMWYGKSSIGHRNGLRVRVYGSNGSAEWLQINPEELLFNTNKGERVVIDRASVVSVANELRYNRFKAGHPSGFVEAFANLYSDMYKSLKIFQVDKESKPVWSYSAAQAAEGLKIFELIETSSEENRWIKNA